MAVLDLSVAVLDQAQYFSCYPGRNALVSLRLVDQVLQEVNQILSIVFLNHGLIGRLYRVYRQLSTQSEVVIVTLDLGYQFCEEEVGAFAFLLLGEELISVSDDVLGFFPVLTEGHILEVVNGIILLDQLEESGGALQLDLLQKSGEQVVHDLPYLLLQHWLGLRLRPLLAEVQPELEGGEAQLQIFAF